MPTHGSLTKAGKVRDQTTRHNRPKPLVYTKRGRRTTGGKKGGRGIFKDRPKNKGNIPRVSNRRSWKKLLYEQSKATRYSRKDI